MQQGRAGQGERMVTGVCVVSFDFFIRSGLAGQGKNHRYRLDLEARSEAGEVSLVQKS